MKYIDDKEKLASAVAVVESTFYDKAGKETKIDERSVCKTVKTTGVNERAETKYYVNTLNGILYDPYGVDSNKKTSMMFKAKEVNSKTFEYYLMYLRNRNNLYMTRAQRSFINA